MHFNRGLVSAGLGAALSLPLAIVLPSSATSSPVVKLMVGHVDAIDVAYEDGELELSVHDETVEPDIERDPAAVRFVALPESAVAVPEDPEYAFLGAPGETVWVLPEIQNEELLWAGLSAEEVDPGVFAGDELTVSFVRVAGPGGFSMFDTALDGGPNLLVDSQDGLRDKITLRAGTHQHVNWGFEAPGTYAVTYRVQGRLVDTGERVRSDLATLTFKVRA
jgi:surface-anchored protein